jgi:hypothetical protein
MTRSSVRIALLADGRSDRALLPILLWLVRQHAPAAALPEPAFRNRNVGKPLAEEIAASIDLYRPDLLFVHRDAESADPEVRRAEIPADQREVVKVVPVRMTEAWLLFDDQAIRRAADRPGGRAPLDLPTLARVEELAEPKERLLEALLVAAEVSGRKRRRFQQDAAARVQRVAELIDDFSPLRRLPAFARLDADCRSFLQRA